MTTSVRRIAGWLAMVWIFVLLMPAHGAQAAYQTSYGVTYKSSTVNLRQQPTQYSTKLGSYAEGSWMAISGESGNWYYVTAPDGKTGYMSKNFVAVGEEITGPVGIVNNPKSSSFLNLRQEPSYSAKVLGIYYNGVPCVLMDSANGWYNVRVNGQSGYFREEYLTLTTMVYSDQVATIVTPGNSGLNLRAGPGMNYPTLKQFSGGQYVMVLQQGLDWWKVSIGGYVGFMSTSFLKSGILGPSSTSQSGSGGGTTDSGSKTGYAIVTNPRSTQVLNLRDTPSTTGRVVGQYVNGTRVTMLRQGVEWCKVQVDKTGVIGYMMSDYLTMYNLPSVPTMTVNHPQKTFVNLRSTPAMSGNQVLTRLPHGATVTVLTPGDSWVKVRYNGYTGYAAAYFLK